MKKEEILESLNIIIDFYIEAHENGDEYENEGLRKRAKEVEKYIEDNLK